MYLHVYAFDASQRHGSRPAPWRRAHCRFYCLAFSLFVALVRCEKDMQNTDHYPHHAPTPPSSSQEATMGPSDPLVRDEEMRDRRIAKRHKAEL